MKTTLEHEEIDWITEDPINKEYIYINQGKCYKTDDKGSRKLLESAELTDKYKKEKEYKSNSHDQGKIFFSSNLSGKNILIHGGGTIATLGRATNEDFALVEKIIPRGIVYIEFICPISCHGLAFGMAGFDFQEQDKSASQILDLENRKNFRFFKTTSRRRVGMEIDYDKRLVKFYLEGALKDKNLHFPQNNSYPCVIISNKSNSVVLNQFGKYEKLNFPLYLSPYVDNKTKKNVFSKMLFVVNIPKLNVSESFVAEDFLFSHFKSIKHQNRLAPKPNKIYVPIDVDAKKLKGFIAISFDSKKELESFKATNSNVIIAGNTVKYLIDDAVDNIAKQVFKEYNLEKLTGKDVGPIDLTIKRINNKEMYNLIFSDDYTNMIIRWLIEEYLNLRFIHHENLSIGEILNQVQSVRENFSRILQEAKEQILSEEKKTNNTTFVVEYLSQFDRLLVIDNSKIKIFARNLSGKFDFDLDPKAIHSDNHTLILTKEDITLLINSIPWNTLILDSADNSVIRAIHQVFYSLKNVKVVYKNIFSIKTYKKTFTKFLEALLVYLNKTVYLSNEKKHLTEAIEKENSISNNIKETGLLELPFAMISPKEEAIEKAVKEDPSTLHNIIKEYHESDNETLFSLYSLIAKLYEQTLNLIDKKDSESLNRNLPKKFLSNLRKFSSIYRLGSYVNYPFSKNMSLTTLSDRGLFVENALTNELKLPGYEHIRLLDSDKITDADKMEEIITRHFPFNLSSISNLWPNITVDYSINTFPHEIQYDHNSKQITSISTFNKSFRIPILVTCSENGNMNIWNYALGLNLVGDLNVKKGIKKISEFKDIKQINWLKKNGTFKSINEILNEDNFQIITSETKPSSLTASTAKSKDKSLELSQEFINNLYMMGFPLDACKFALKEFENNFDKALEFLLEKTSDPEFMKKYSPKELEKETKLEPWNCTECTFYNTSGGYNCEICSFPVPENILKEHMDKKSRLDEKRETKLIEIIPESPVFEFKDSMVKNVHFIYNNRDPVAPFIVVSVLFDVILNNMIISCYKLMINPVVLKDFIQIDKENVFTSKIDNKKFYKVKDAVEHLNSYYFNNLHTLYPRYVGSVNNSEDDYYKHLIPVEHTHIKLPIVSVFDSFAFEQDGESNLSILVEKNMGDVTLLNFSIKNNYKFNMISEQSIEIDYVVGNNIQDNFKDLYPSELKIIRDTNFYYVFTGDSIIQLNKEFKFLKSYEYKQVGLFKKVEPLFTNGILTEVKIFDDVNKCMKLSLNDVKIHKELSENLNQQKENIENKIRLLNVEDFNLTELNILAQLLDFERVNFKLTGKPADDDKFGIKQINFTEYKKLYVDLRKNSNETFQTLVEFSQPSIVVMGNIEFILKLKNSESKSIKLSNYSNAINSTSSSPENNIVLSSIENELKNLIPLTIVNYTGSQSQVYVNVSSIIFGEGKFMSNYPNPEFLFSHIHGKIMNIDSFLVGSDLGSTGEVPFGEGLVFLFNDIESIKLAKEFSKFNESNFEEFVKEKKIRKEEIFEWEPTAYIVMGEKEYVRTKINIKRPCKYIYLLPTNARRLPKDFREKFDERSMGIKLFAAEGEVNPNKLETTEYLNKNVEEILSSNNLRSVTDFRLSVKGFSTNMNDYVSLDEKSHEHHLKINGILPNPHLNLDNTNLFTSKLNIGNHSSQNNLFTKFQLELKNIRNDPNYSLLGFNIEFLTFKSNYKHLLKECEILKELDICQLRSIIVERDKFDMFNNKFTESLCKSKIDLKKRLAIIKFLKYLSIKVPSIAEAIENSLDYIELIKINILESNSSDLINSSLELIKSFKSSNSSSKILSSILNLLENFTATKFSQLGFRNFFSLLNTFPIDEKILISKILTIINFSLNSVKNSNFQSNLNIFLKSHLKVEDTPFDQKIFLTQTASSGYKTEDLNSLNAEIQGKLINSKILGELNEDTLRFNIDLIQNHKVEAIRLLFNPSECSDNHFKIFIWGSNYNITREKNFNLLNHKFYSDHTWKQLTKYENVIKLNPNRFNTSDIRSLEIDEINFTGRYLIIEISLSMGERNSKIFPTNLDIVPQIFGEIQVESTNYEMIQFEEIFLKNRIVNFANNFTYSLISNSDNSRFIVQMENEEFSSNNFKTNETSHNQVELSKLIQNLKSFQTNLEKTLTELLNRRENVESSQLVKIKSLLEDIKTIQTKIISQSPLMKIDESYSINVNVLSTLIKLIKNLCHKNSQSFKEVYENFFSTEEDQQEFIKNLIEVCVINENGELHTETLSILKSLIWPILKENQKLFSHIFDYIVEEFLSRDVYYRSPLQIIEALSYIDFPVEAILTKLKDAFKRNWGETEIPDAFYNISSLIILLIMKIKNKDSNISKKSVEIINVNIEFIRYLTQESKFNKDVNDIILSHSLNLLQECFKTTEFETLNQIINPELIEYMVSTMFSFWENIDIKNKIMDIIEKLVDPFNLGEKHKIKKINNLDTLQLLKTKSLSSKITLNTQVLALNYLKDFLCNFKFSSEISDEKSHKLDYIFNLLIKTYSINTRISEQLQSKKDDTLESVEIKKNNSEIIEKFIKVIIQLNETNKIGYSAANNFWRYLTEILERGNLEMIFYNNIFSNLILNSFLKFDNHLQELLYTKFIKVFLSLFTAEGNKTREMFDEVTNVILHILAKTTGTNLETISIPFITQLSEIILSNQTPLLDSLAFNTSYEISHEIRRKLFIEVSYFLAQFVNYASFTGTTGSNKIVYNRVNIAKILMQLINTFVSNYLENINEKDINSEFRMSIRNYIIFYVFDCYTYEDTSPPVWVKVSKTWKFVKSIIEICSKRKNLIEIMLTEFMKIVRKVDDQIFSGIRQNRISLKKGMVICEKLFTSLEEVLNSCLYDDEITKFFAFELEGFNFFIDRVNNHRKHMKFNTTISSTSNTVSYKLNPDLLKSLTIKTETTTTKTTSNEKAKEDDLIQENLDELNYQEFAINNKLDLLEGELSEPNVINNINWSSKKKCVNSHVYTRDMKNKTYHEEVFHFQLPHQIEVKDVMIGFNYNISNMNDKLGGLVPAVFLEAGKSFDKMDICVKLEKLEDSAYLEKGVLVFGFNFFSYNSEMVPVDDNYLDTLLNQLVNCRARCFRFIVRRPLLLSNDNSHNNKISMNNIILGINHVSLNGTKIADTQKVIEYIQEKEKSVSIKIISKIFTAEFIDTLKYIANDSNTINNIKEIYDAFEPYIEKHASILSNILINVSKYNLELGDWLMNRLLNIDKSELHAKLAIEVAQNNFEYVNDRINKFLSFIIRELNPNSPLFFSHDVDTKLRNIGNFVHYLTISLNGLLISPYQEKIIDLTIDFDSFLSLIKNLQKYSPISLEIQKLITLLLIPNKKLRLNHFLDPEEAVILLHESYLNTFIFDYLDILSYLVANSDIYDRICQKKKLLNYYLDQFLQQVNSGIRGKNMLAFMNILKNMSFSTNFIEIIREKDYDFKILDSVKNKSEKADSILINNNTNFLNNLVILIRNSVINYPECQKKLAEILINDLEVCKKKIDKAYANNVLMPLLRMEKHLNICVHPTNSILKTITSTYCKFTNRMSEGASSDSAEVKTQLQSKNYLPGSLLPKKSQNLLKDLITTTEYSPKKTFGNEDFKLVYSSVKAEKKNHIEELSKAISNVGPFLLIIYPSNTTYSDSDLYTFFYCDGKIPTLPTSVISTDSSTINIPYTYKNIIGQMQEDKYIAAQIKAEYDDTTGKEYEIGFLSYSSYCINLVISGDIINLNLYDDKSSVNPYPEVLSTLKSNGMTEMKYVTAKDYEVYIPVNVDKNKSHVDALKTGPLNKLIATKYVDETGNLDLDKVKFMKYFKSNHPLNVLRNNPVLEIPVNVTIKILKEFLIQDNIDFRLLTNIHTLSNETTMIEIVEQLEQIYQKECRIADISYDIPSLRGLITSSDKSLNVIPNYEPILPVFMAFEKLDGIRKIVSVLKNTIRLWKNKEAMEFWTKWIDDVEKFSELPSFFATLIRHQKCFDTIFSLLCGLHDNESAHKEIGIEANKYIYEILNNSFMANQSLELRKIAIEKGIFTNILERLELLTREKPRRYAPNGENIEKEAESSKEKESKETTKETSNKKDNKKNVKKGIGYGSDQTGDNKTWDVNKYLEGKKNNSQQIASIIELLSNFFSTHELKATDVLMKYILESPILPVLESAFRGGSLLELAKEDTLYYSYLHFTSKLSDNPYMVAFLLDIPKDYLPIQTSSVYTLLGQLNEAAKVFVNCIKKDSEEKSTEEKLALEITKTYDFVQKNVKAYQKHLDMDKHYGDILKLPLKQSYPLLMKELSFDYMSMKDANGKIIHHYASSMSGTSSSTKLIRLAQEYADLSRALPCEDTNAIFIRVDQDNMDLMKALILGSAGTPYGHGAFEYDVYFDSQYPNGPPKVNLMTTGNGLVRFNPNLYANGKVCLSLLGTWRGQSTENWDPKISTLLQVLISIQSIIMSELVYFNEPSCESEMGKPEGEAKNEAYSNIVRYCNVKYAMIEQIKKPSKGFEEVIRRHFYLKKEMILQEVKGWIERSKTVDAKYTSYSYDHNTSWAQKMSNSKQYTKMLEEIYVELEKELNELPMPTELKKKTEESEKIAHEKTKQKEKMEFISLENVDVEYDNDNVQLKEINVDDEAVKDRWSRYIGAMGIDAVKRQANSSVFLSGANGLGIEIAKNIVLSGCKKFVLHDTRKTTHFDLSSQFFLGEDDVGFNRSEASIKKLQQLNFYVKILASTAFLPKEESDLDKFGLKDFNIVILTQCDYETQISINRYCRKRGIHFISTDLFGVFGRVINDFGEKFIVNDKDGEELKECMIKSISQEQEGVVTVLENTRHNFEDDDEVLITEVEGMDIIQQESSDVMEKVEKDNKYTKSINSTIHKVKVINSTTFKIGDTSNFSKYIRNGLVKQLKTKKEITFNDLENALFNKETPLDMNMAISDFTKISNAKPIHIGFEALDVFFKKNKSYPSPWSVKESLEIVENANEISKKMDYQLNENDLKIINYLSFTSQSQLSPLAAFFGGVVAQEAIKAMTGKFTPINQIFYYDAIEVLPSIDVNKLEESVKNIEFSLSKKRNDGLEIIVGSSILKKITEMKILVVGSGAIGCELLKNFAMLEVGTFKSKEENKNGSIVVTDPDIIEVSNLNRQFLFREKHLRQPKSSTAAAAVIQMNKNLKNHIFARLDKVCEETEHIFSDKFFSGLTLVANALDNINARRYVDSRCVTNRIPLLESGTLGPKGHVQVVVPFKTESYSSQNDPEVTNDIPQCTLKMFPEEAMHCVEWARDQFGKIFTQKPKVVNKCLDEGEDNQEIKIIRQVYKHLKKSPTTFDNCIRLAREKFQKLFHNNIKQLLFSYPLDKKNKDGSLFWSLPKRPPISLEFNPEDNLHNSFVTAYACLLANQFKIKIPYEKVRTDLTKLEIAKKAAEYKQPEFKPNQLKAKQIEKEVEKQKKEVEENSKEEDETEMIQESEEDILKEYKELIKKLHLDNYSSLNEKEKKTKELVSEEFEKDNDSNFHIDIIHSMAGLRCKNYKLEEMDWMKVKLKAGRIIPALATTTAAIAGLQSLELVKIAKNLEIEHIRNSFLNLAIPFLQASEPGSAFQNKLKDDLSVTLWDRWEIQPEQLNLKSIYETLQNKYGLFPRDCFKGKKAVFAYSAYSGDEKKETRVEIMNKNLKSLIGLSEEDEYVDLFITFTKDEISDVYLKNIPTVRINLKK